MPLAIRIDVYNNQGAAAMLNKTISIGLAILGLSVPILAHAQDESGFYVGAAVGKADNRSGEFHGDDTAFELFGGYTFNDYLSVEVGYVDAGTQRDRIEDIDVSNESDAELRSGDERVTDHDSDSDLVFGAGIQYRFAEHFAISADYKYVDVSDGAAYIVTVGATVRF